MTSKHPNIRIGLAAVAALVPSLAFAHVGVSPLHDLIHGFAHPLTGIDHILAMLAVGVFAASLGGRALWTVPLSFMGGMLFGGALGVFGVGLPLVEVGIALSLVVLGAAVAMKWDLPVASAMALVGLFAIFHGHAHGSEMAFDASAATYGAGFVTATGLLHLIGIGIGLGAGSLRASHRIAQFGGAALAIVGVALLGGII
jgi:urease accessory protein